MKHELESTLAMEKRCEKVPRLHPSAGAQGQRGPRQQGIGE